MNKFLLFGGLTMWLWSVCPTFVAAIDNMPDIQLDFHSHAGSGENTPFWLKANEFGKYDLENSAGLLSLGVFSRKDTSVTWDVNYGAELINRYDGNQKFWYHQLFVELSYDQYLRVRAGWWEETLGNEYTALSSGSVIWSANARPMPKLDFGTAGFVEVPYTGGLFEMKGSMAHGWFERDRYVKGVMLHQKYAALRSSWSFPLQIYHSFYHFAQWGGQHPAHGALPAGLSDFIRLFFVRSGGEDAPLGWQQNKFGNHIGSRNYGIDYHLPGFTLGSYHQDIFEDGSGMRRRNFPDGLWGLSFRNHNPNALVTGFVYEYLQTTDQSGPVHDMELELGGDDNYFNHSVYYSGWTHHHMIIGTPLITSPIYTRHIDQFGSMRIWNNRIKAHHVGIKGKIAPDLTYRVRVTYSKNKGLHASTITVPQVFKIEQPLGQWSWRTDLQYLIMPNLTSVLNVGVDRGEMYGDNVGVRVGLRYQLPGRISAKQVVN